MQLWLFPEFDKAFLIVIKTNQKALDRSFFFKFHFFSACIFNSQFDCTSFSWIFRDVKAF